MLLIKKICLVFILLFLNAFYIQKKINLISIKPLDGVKNLAPDPNIYIKGIFNNTYQDSLNKYVNENMGFRPWLVRLFAQLNFSLFYSTNAPGVVIGKNRHLFIESYINNYIGINFVGKNKADENISKIKAVQDSLKNFGIDLVIIFAPGKASYYPYNIPDSYIMRKKDTSNYTYYSTKFNSNGINFIDFNKYFIENKNSFVYPIYPEFGTHWTPYGSSIAMDSIIHYLEAKRKINIPDFDYSHISLSDSLHEREYDIGILLNLSKVLSHKPMPYPAYRYTYSNGQTKPDVLVVGDSYWWCMVGDDIPYHVFKNDEYWFYNKDRYIRNSKQDKSVADISFSNETVNRDVIILMATEATFDLFPYGFINKAYDVYCLNDDEKRKAIAKKINGDENWKKIILVKAKENHSTEKEQIEKDIDYVLAQEYTPRKTSKSVFNEIIKEYEMKIKKDPAWMEQIKQKAIQNQVPVEEQLNKDAWFLYESEYGSNEVKEALEGIRHRIKASLEWLKQIKTKAKEKNISIEEMLELDAKYVYDMDKKKGKI